MKPTGCNCWPLRIYNPDKKVLEFTKQLIDFGMKYILENV